MIILLGYTDLLGPSIWHQHDAITGQEVRAGENLSHLRPLPVALITPGRHVTFRASPGGLMKVVRRSGGQLCSVISHGVGTEAAATSKLCQSLVMASR